MIFVESPCSSVWEERHNLQNFDSSSLNNFNVYSDKDLCFRLKITDSESNRIYCENGNLWSNVCWNDKIVLTCLLLCSLMSLSCDHRFKSLRWITSHSKMVMGGRELHYLHVLIQFLSTLSCPHHCYLSLQVYLHTSLQENHLACYHWSH